MSTITPERRFELALAAVAAKYPDLDETAASKLADGLVALKLALDAGVDPAVAKAWAVKLFESEAQS